MISNQEWVTMAHARYYKSPFKKSVGDTTFLSRKVLDYNCVFHRKFLVYIASQPMHKTDLYLEGAIKEVLIFKVTLFVDIELKHSD